MAPGVLEAAERFMAEWHVEEPKKISERRAARMHGAQSRRRGRGVGEPWLKKASETADGVARHQAD